MIIEHNLQVPDSLAGQRLDKAVASLLPQYSRARLQGWIKGGQLTVDGDFAVQKARVLGGEDIQLKAQLESSKALPEDLPLNIVHEDAALIVINKPAGLVVHPGAGNPTGTLMNGLLHHYPELASVPRAGIVHRIDKDTTGLLVVARTIEAQLSLVTAMQERQIGRTYQALVFGRLEAQASRQVHGKVPIDNDRKSTRPASVSTKGKPSGANHDAVNSNMQDTQGGKPTITINAPVARHPMTRTRMAVRPDGKPAITHVTVQQHYGAVCTLLKCQLETGRTHQIRVHLQSIGHPLVGDPVYSGGYQLPQDSSDKDSYKEKAIYQQLKQYQRQALHAGQLQLKHPTTGEHHVFAATLPDDFSALLDLFRTNQVDSSRL